MILMVGNGRSSDINNGTTTLHHSREEAQSELGLFQSS